MAESLRRRSTLAPAERAAVDECGTIESSDSEALKRTPCRTRVGVSGRTGSLAKRPSFPFETCDLTCGRKITAKESVIPKSL